MNSSSFCSNCLWSIATLDFADTLECLLKYGRWKVAGHRPGMSGPDRKSVPVLIRTDWYRFPDYTSWSGPLYWFSVLIFSTTDRTNLIGTDFPDHGSDQVIWSGKSVPRTGPKKNPDRKSVPRTGGPDIPGHRIERSFYLCWIEIFFHVSLKSTSKNFHFLCKVITRLFWCSIPDIIVAEKMVRYCHSYQCNQISRKLPFDGTVIWFTNEWQFH